MSSCAIVGGGISGTAVFLKLVDGWKAFSSPPHHQDGVNKKHPLHIHWFEKASNFGPGLAWGDANSDVHLFNLPAGVASVRLGAYGVFLGWCKATGTLPDVEFSSFPPRRIFGPFVSSQVEEAINAAKDIGIKVTLHKNTEVTNIDRVPGNSFEISFKTNADNDTTTITAVGAVFLSTGPASLSNNLYPQIVGRDNYIVNPWPYTSLQRIPNDASVCVIGTGLTAVDVVKQLRNQGHKAHIVMASRQGLLPTIKARAADPFRPLNFANQATVQNTIVSAGGGGSTGLLVSFLELLKKEFHSFIEEFVAEEDKSSAELENMKHCVDLVLLYGNSPFVNGTDALRAGLAFAETGKRSPWQDCIIALSIQDIIRTMWGALCDEDKSTVQRKYGTLMQVYFNSMPECSGRDVLSLLDSGSCTLVSGLKNISLAGDELESSFLLDSTAMGCPPVNYVVNATGFRKHYADANETQREGDQDLSLLSRNIIRNGLASPDKFGGLQCDFISCLLRSGRKDKDDAVAADANADVDAALSPPLIYGIGHTICGCKGLTSGLSYCLMDGMAAVKDFSQRMDAAAAVAVEGGK